MTLTFGEKIGRLEEVIVDLLFTGMPYVKVVSTYNGELGDRAKLVEALRTLKGEMPLVLIGYTGGKDEPVGRPPSPNGPLELRHEATIEVVCCADDSRAQYKRERAGGTLTRKGGMALSHRMFSDVRELLTNRQFAVTVDDEQVVLNEGELIPLDNEYIERITGLTAVSTPFGLYFDYATPDHAEPPAGEIAVINFDIGVGRGDGALRHPPGVFPAT